MEAMRLRLWLVLGFAALAAFVAFTPGGAAADEGSAASMSSSVEGHVAHAVLLSSPPSLQSAPCPCSTRPPGALPIPPPGIPRPRTSATPPSPATIAQGSGVSLAGPTSFDIARNTVLDNTGTGGTGNLSSTLEPSVGAGHDDTVFYTGNWFASVSYDGGKTFSYINPYKLFPSVAGGFCCDQVALYDKSHNLFIWMLQYQPSNGSSVQRIAVATPQQIKSGNWYYWDFTPQMLGWPAGRVFDFPDMALSSNMLWASSNGFANLNKGSTALGATIWRISLNQLAARGHIDFNYATITGKDSFRLTHGATSAMYWGCWGSSSAIRIFHWFETSGSYAWKDVSVNSFNYLNSDGVATSPDGTNFAGFADSRILGAWITAANGGQVGFMWNAKQGGNYPYPYVEVARFGWDKHFIDQFEIWNKNHAWLYPSAAVDARGDVGGTLVWGGGQYYPNTTAWIVDGVSNTFAPLENITVTSGTAGPSNNRWGDFFSTRPYPGSGGNSWVAGAFALEGGTFAPATTAAHYIWFGRESDLPVVLQNDTPYLSETYPGYFQFSVQSGSWAAVGINPGIDDHNVQASVFNDLNPSYIYSTLSGLTRDFVVANGAVYGNATHYAEVTGPSSPYWIEAEWQAHDLSVGVPMGETFGLADILDVFQVYLTAGTSYQAVAHVTSGTPDLGLYMFTSSIVNDNRANASIAANSSGPGGDETFTFTAGESGWYGFVVMHENSDYGTYTLSVGPKPTWILAIRALDFLGRSLAGVQLSPTSGGSGGTTNSDGFVGVHVPDGWSGIISPSLRGYKFMPPSFSYSNVTSDQPVQSFSGGLDLTIGAAKQEPDNTSIYLSSKVVTATLPNGTQPPNLYVEEPDRSSGIQLPAVQAPSSVVDAGGGLTTVGGERALVSAVVEGVAGAAPAAIKPLHVTNRALGGSAFGSYTPGIPGAAGLNNLGLLVRTEGRVTAVSGGNFYIDDGSGVLDSAPTVGVLVDTSGVFVTPPSVGKYVKVTGISGAMTPIGSAKTIRMLRPRGAPDIVVVPRSVALVYGPGIGAAFALQSLLQYNGIKATLMKDATVALTNLQGYDVIIIAADSSAASNTDEERVIYASGKPVLGMGAGGSNYFNSFSPNIGWGDSAIFTGQTDILPENTTSQVYSTPNAISSGQQTLYSSSTDVVAAYSPYFPSNVLSFGVLPNYQRYCPIASEGSDVLWGYYGPEGNMTAVGQQLFVNLVWYSASL